MIRAAKQYLTIFNCKPYAYLSGYYCLPFYFSVLFITEIKIYFQIVPHYLKEIEIAC